MITIALGLQLHVYKWMIETELGFRVAAMVLGQVHSCLARAKLIQVPSMVEELELMVEDQIHRGRGYERGAARCDICAAAAKSFRGKCSCMCTHASTSHARCLVAPCLPFICHTSCVIRFATAQDADIFERGPQSSLSVCSMEAPHRLSVGC